MSVYRSGRKYTWDFWFSYSTPSSRISSPMILNATIMLENMICLTSLRSSGRKPSAYIILICLSIVDFPDSPAPKKESVSYHPPWMAARDTNQGAIFWPALLPASCLCEASFQFHYCASSLHSLTESESSPWSWENICRTWRNKISGSRSR